MNYINSEQMTKFLEDGYLVIKNVFDESELSQMQNLFDLLLEDAKSYEGESYLGQDCHYIFDEGRLNRIVWCGGRQEKLLEYGINKKITGPVSDLLKTKDITQIINQAHFKLPGENVEFEWHQDSDHRRYDTDLWNDLGINGSYIQSVVAIDKMTYDNGPLKALKNSHENGHLGLKKNPSQIDRLVREYEEVVFEMNAGDVIFFGPYLIHSSSINTTDMQRRVFINGFCTKGANKKEYPGVGIGRELCIE